MRTKDRPGVVMPDSKHLNWVDVSTDAGAQADDADKSVAPSQPAANDADVSGYRRHPRPVVAGSESILPFTPGRATATGPRR